MEKLYERINFENAPSKKTPVSAENLNKMDKAIGNLDDRIIEETTRLKSDLGKRKQDLCSVFPSRNGYISYDTDTHIFSIPALTTLYHKDAAYLISNDLTIDVSSFASYTQVYAIKIVYNVDSGKLECKQYNQNFTGIPVALINIDTNDGVVKSRMYVNGAFSVDGYMYGVATFNMNLASWNLDYDYIKINALNKTIEIPRCYPINDGKYFELAGGVYSYSNVSGTGIRLFANANTHEVKVTGTDYMPKKNELLLLMFVVYANEPTIRSIISNLPYRIISHDIMFSNFTPLANYSGDSEYLGMTQKAITDFVDAKLVNGNVGVNRGFIKSVNHRGFQTVAPENTLHAFVLSKKMGFDWIETDVQFTSDGIPVILHDTTINRTARNADGSQLSSTVNISDVTYAELLNYDFGIWKSSEYAGTKIPKFEEMISLCRNIGLSVRIELKDYSLKQENIKTLYDIVKKYGMLGNVEWASFTSTALGHVHSIDAEANICLIVSTINEWAIDTAKSLRDSNVVTIATGIDTLDYAQMVLASENKIPVDAWTITSATQIVNCHPYVSSFTTDAPNAGDVLYKASIN